MILQPLTIILVLTATKYVSGEIDLSKFEFFNGINRNNNFDVQDSFGILNGTKTDILHHPYQAAIWFYLSNNDKRFALSGAIVNKNWVLTLAILPVYGSMLRISTGQSKLSKSTQLLEVEKIVLHPSYSGGTGYQASLIKLKKPLKFSKSVRSIAVSSSTPKGGSKAVTSGWGIKDFTNFTVSDDLLEAQLSVITQEDCKPKYIASFVSETIYCASKANVRPTAYDGGNPFVQNKKLVGLFFADLSSPAVCITYPDCPALFTDVTLLKSWITETIKKE